MKNLLAVSGFKSKEDYVKAIGDKMESDGVKISEFSEDQQREIITMYAATLAS